VHGQGGERRGCKIRRWAGSQTDGRQPVGWAALRAGGCRPRNISDGMFYEDDYMYITVRHVYIHIHIYICKHLHGVVLNLNVHIYLSIYIQHTQQMIRVQNTFRAGV
jgi:hypothetical protein